MIKTPTYYVFSMYKHHQDGTLIKSFVDTKTIGLEEEYQVPNLHESCSRGKDGKYHITLANLSVEESYDISTDLLGNQIKSAKAEILTGKMDDKNTFDAPETVKVSAFEGLKTEGDKISFSIPKNSVLHIEVELS